MVIAGPESEDFYKYHTEMMVKSIITRADARRGRCAPARSTPWEARPGRARSR